MFFIFVDLSQRQKFLYCELFQNYDTHIHTHTHTHTHTLCAGKVIQETWNMLLIPKEALIGEHNLKPLLTIHKESIDWWSLLGNKPVQPRYIHMISLLLTLIPRTYVITRTSYSSWVKTTYNTL